VGFGFGRELLVVEALAAEEVSLPSTRSSSDGRFSQLVAARSKMEELRAYALAIRAVMTGAAYLNAARPVGVRAASFAE